MISHSYILRNADLIADFVPPGEVPMRYDMSPWQLNTVYHSKRVLVPGPGTGSLSVS